MEILTYATVHISGPSGQCGFSLRTLRAGRLVLLVVVGANRTVHAAVTAALVICPSWTNDCKQPMYGCIFEKELT